jgi:ABC-type glycerol-3-phosphate transport system substrate-binding protein
MRRNFLLTLLLAILLIIGCRQNSTKVEVTFWHAMGGNVEKVLKAMVADFESTHKHIRIKLVGMADYNTLAQKLMSAAAVNSPPTIAQMYENWTTQLLTNDYLEPLESYVKGSKGLTSNEFNDIWPVLIQNNTWDGKIITLPFNKSVPVYYYNTELFEKVGIKEFPKTWNDFREVCFKLKNLKDKEGNVIIPTAGGTDIWVFASMLYQKGGKLFDEDRGEPLFNSPVAAEVLQFQLDLIYKDKVQSSRTGADLLEEFLAGRLAMTPFSCARRALMKGVESFKIGMAPLPIWDKPRPSEISFKDTDKIGYEKKEGRGKPASIIYGTNIGTNLQGGQAARMRTGALLTHPGHRSGEEAR